MDMMLTQTFRNSKKNMLQKKKNLPREQKKRKELKEQKEKKHMMKLKKMKQLMKPKKEARRLLNPSKFIV